MTSPSSTPHSATVFVSSTSGAMLCTSSISACGTLVSSSARACRSCMVRSAPTSRGETSPLLLVMLIFIAAARCGIRFYCRRAVGKRIYGYMNMKTLVCTSHRSTTEDKSPLGIRMYTRGQLRLRITSPICTLTLRSRSNLMTLIRNIEITTRCALKMPDYLGDQQRKVKSDTGDDDKIQCK